MTVIVRRIGALDKDLTSIQEARDLVLTCAGSSARQTAITKDTPVDAVVMAVIDSLEVDGKVTFRKS